jgi:hypothetical protein
MRRRSELRLQSPAARLEGRKQYPRAMIVPPSLSGLKISSKTRKECFQSRAMPRRNLQNLPPASLPLKARLLGAARLLKEARMLGIARSNEARLLEVARRKEASLKPNKVRLLEVARSKEARLKSQKARQRL